MGRCYTGCIRPSWYSFAVTRTWRLVGGALEVTVHEHYACRACSALYTDSSDVCRYERRERGWVSTAALVVVRAYREALSQRIAGGVR